MDAAPLSVYLDLFDGRKADLEVVARASLALASAIREVAYANNEELNRMLSLIGDGSRYPDGRRGKPGVDIPITLGIYRVDRDSSPKPIFEETITTQGYDSQQLSWDNRGSFSRTITRLPLEPGLYRFHAQTSRNCPELVGKSSLFVIIVDRRSLPPRK